MPIATKVIHSQRIYELLSTFDVMYNDSPVIISVDCSSRNLLSAEFIKQQQPCQLGQIRHFCLIWMVTLLYQK